MSKRKFTAALALLLVLLICWPSQWYPMPVRKQLAEWFGATAYRPAPAEQPGDQQQAEIDCPEDHFGWRQSTNIEGVEIQEDLQCVVDSPDEVAAFVRGTNNVSGQVLGNSGLAADAVVKKNDIDGDGDPDEIEIRLEVVELNGTAPDSAELSTQYAIAPGVKPGLWVFAPKTIGMATENFESRSARRTLRLPSPAIRVEQGDRVKVILENTHYLPHTIHFHGVDHSFVDEAGEGNDGVPLTSEPAIEPGGARTYELQPRHAGTMFYHCHVQTQVHAMMGLQGLFVIEENQPNNWVQTMNLGGGLVRSPSQSVRNDYDREYDLHYLDIDEELNSIIQESNDARVVNNALLRQYNTTQAQREYFTLNGVSFPYTFRESLLIAKDEETIRMRVLNGGANGLALHTHGHKVTITHNDGVAVNPAARITRDVVWVAAAQRADLTLRTSNDGLHSYGQGIWLLHDHQPAGITTDGIGPGGNISAIVYEDYLGENGWPETRGEELAQYFSADYYSRPEGSWFAGPDEPLKADGRLLFRLVVIGIAIGLLMALAVGRSRR